MFPACFLTLDVCRSRPEGRLAPVIFSAILSVCFNLFLSCFVADPKQTVTDAQGTDWVIALPEFAEEVNHLLDLFDDSVYVEHLEMDPRNLKASTVDTGLLIIVMGGSVCVCEPFSQF